MGLCLTVPRHGSLTGSQYRSRFLSRRTSSLCRRLHHDSRLGRDRWSRLPIHQAMIIGAPIGIIKQLLYAFPESVSTTDHYGNLPLHLAMVSKHASDAVVYYQQVLQDRTHQEQGQNVARRVRSQRQACPRVVPNPRQDDAVHAPVHQAIVGSDRYDFDRRTPDKLQGTLLHDLQKMEAGKWDQVTEFLVKGK